MICQMTDDQDPSRLRQKLRHTEEERVRADEGRKRAEMEAERERKERERAEKEAAREKKGRLKAEKEAARNAAEAEKFKAMLRAAGIDPDAAREELKP